MVETQNILAFVQRVLDIIAILVIDMFIIKDRRSIINMFEDLGGFAHLLLEASIKPIA